MEIKAQQKSTIARPMFFLRRSLKEARTCTAGFQSIALTCMPRDKFPKLSEKGEMQDFPRSPVVKISPSNAGVAGLIPGQGTKIPHASQPKTQNIKQKKQCCNKFSKDLKDDPYKKNLEKK